MLSETEPEFFKRSEQKRYQLGRRPGRNASKDTRETPRSVKRLIQPRRAGTLEEYHSKIEALEAVTSTPENVKRLHSGRIQPETPSGLYKPIQPEIVSHRSQYKRIEAHTRHGNKTAV